MKHHSLKIYPEYFKEILSGQKTFELRFNDRGFEPGDTVDLHECQESRIFSGRMVSATIGFVLALRGRYCVFSLIGPKPGIYTGGFPAHPRFTPDMALSDILERVDMDKGLPLFSSVQRFEEELLRRALDNAGGHKANAAKLLQLNRTTFIAKCVKYGIGGRDEPG